jgi:hypothetical protein
LTPTLVLALDGIPLRVVLEAQGRGAFSSWTPARPLIAPFPSLTNVSFTAMFHVLDVAPARGYEFLYFDRLCNRHSGVKIVSYGRHRFAWRNKFHSAKPSALVQLLLYTVPSIGSRMELSGVESALFGSNRRLFLACIGSTNAMQVLDGDEQTLRFLARLTEWITRVQQRHQRERGGPLRIVLLSDHGNSDTKIRRIKGIPQHLREAGLRVVRRLRRNDDVVAPTFGLVGYGALYVKPDRAQVAARAVVTHPAVSLAAWRCAPGEIRVTSAKGEARVRWREVEEGREFAYETDGADPLCLAESRAHLESVNKIDPAGFAGDRDWFNASLTSPYPDALHRLVDSLSGRHVINRADVIFSLEPGFCWGVTWARWIFWLCGGRLAGTHGGLDSVSSTGFFMATDPLLDPGSALRAEWALMRLVRQDRGSV